MLREAETELRLAFDDATKANRLFYMTLAAEPLIDLELDKGRIEAADAVLASLRGIDPERMDRDYRVSLLQLRMALAKGDIGDIKDSHARALSLAGERILPIRPLASPALQPEKAMGIAKGLP